MSRISGCSLSAAAGSGLARLLHDICRETSHAHTSKCTEVDLQSFGVKNCFGKAGQTNAAEGLEKPWPQKTAQGLRVPWLGPIDTL